MGRLWERLLAFFNGLLGHKHEPRDQLRDWIRELQEQVGPLDVAMAGMRGRVVQHEGLVRTCKHRTTQVELQIKDALAAGERKRAATLALERNLYMEQQARAEEKLEESRRDYERAVRLRQHYLTGMTRQIKELQEILRAESSAQWAARVETITATYQAAGKQSLAEQLLEEVRVQSEGKAAKARVDADLKNLGIDFATLETPPPGSADESLPEPPMAESA